MKVFLIGKQAEVIESTNKSQIGLKGTIEDETKYSFVIDGKRVLKKNCTLKVGDLVVDGSKILKRPFDRIK